MQIYQLGRAFLSCSIINSNQLEQTSNSTSAPHAHGASYRKMKVMIVVVKMILRMTLKVIDVERIMPQNLITKKKAIVVLSLIHI